LEALDIFRFCVVSFFSTKVVKYQFSLFINRLNLVAMKALRIKKFDQDLKLSRFEIVLIKDIAFQKLTYFSIKNEANFDFKLHNGVEFLLRLPCDKVQFELFKRRWERFKENDDYYFDLSEWTK